MTWILIGIGLSLTVYGLIGKYKQLKEYQQDKQVVRQDNLPVKENITGIMEQQLINQQEKLVVVNREMDRLLNEITRKEQLMKKALADLTRNYELREEESFRSIFTHTIRGRDRESIPEKYSNVLVLHKKGLGVDEIARELDLGVRETGLILKLYRKEEDTIAG